MISFRRIVLSPLCILLFCIHPEIGNSQSTKEKNSLDQIDEIVKEYVSLYKFNGNILIGKGNEIVYESSNGCANYEFGISNTKETKFRLASLSKQFTASALLVLEQEGKVDFNKPLSNYIKNLDPKIANKITIHQILSHSSGLSRDIESLADQKLGKEFISLDKIIELINSSEFASKPGEKWAYSNLGYSLAAKVIESVTNVSYGEALDQILFKPLGMNNTGHEKSSAMIFNKASGYVSLPTGIVKASYEDKSYVIGAGSIYSTTGDLFIWSRALKNHTLLNKKNTEKLFTKQKGRYSYGWFVDTYVWPPVNDKTQAVNIHHDGGSPGFESKLSILTKHDAVIIILSNKLPSNLAKLANHLTNTYLGFDEGFPKPNGNQEFFNTLFTQGVDGVASLIKNWKVSKKNHLMPDALEVLLVGRGYIDSQDYNKAILVMDVLIKMKPKWSHPYLFKGIVLEEQEKYKEARELYKKVLEVRPGQSNAINRLRVLKQK
tara:strand:- start:7121 stop:8596 length:1476 start_codon:yes stop_codon:yes gene_type:complete